MKVRGVRGATTVKSNAADAIQRATRELLALMIRVNDIRHEDIASVILTATSKLNATFPAEGARQLLGPDVPLLSASEVDVPDAPPNCIRILVHWNTTKSQEQIHPVYINGAQSVITEPIASYDARALRDWVDANAPRIAGQMTELQTKRRRDRSMHNSSPKLHNAMWPGLVGKGTDEGQEPPISLEHMLDLTAAAEVNGQKFEGIDYFLFLPHTNPEASDDELRGIADMIASKGFSVGSLVAPVWPGTVGDSAMGNETARQKFLSAVKMACRVAGIFNEHGVRQYGVIRIDSAEFGVEKWRANAKANTTKIANTFREAAKIAADHGERLAAEGEICWAGMHSWKDMLDLLEEVAMPETLGFQADMAHTYLYLMGYNAPEHALLHEGYTDDEFYAAYEKMVDKLRPWTIDFHIAQNDGHVHGAGAHDKTGKHCPADDPNGKLDIVKCAGYWLKDAPARGIKHICWDGCMFPNAMLEDGKTWNTILDVMIKVREAHGWN